SSMRMHAFAKQCRSRADSSGRLDTPAAWLQNAHETWDLAVRREAAKASSKRHLLRSSPRTAGDGLQRCDADRGSGSLAGSLAKVRKSVHTSLATSPRRKIFCGCGVGLLQLALCELMKRFPQLLQSTVDARSNGIEFAAQEFGNFLVLQFLKAAEQQNFSFVFRQLLEGALQQFDFLVS